MEKTTPYKIKVLEKTLRLLELFDEKGKELTLSEIRELLDLNKSTVFRILNILTEASYIEKDSATSRYRLGFKLYHLGSMVEGLAEIKNLAHPFLEELTEKCNETVHLVVLDHGEALYLDKQEGKRAIRVVSKVGWRLPAHCSGVGKAMLSCLSDEAVEKIIQEKGMKRFTNNTITELDSLQKALARIRKQGYAVDNEEIEIGLRCIAAPLKYSKGDTIAAISVSGSKDHINGTEMKRLIPLVKSTAARILDTFNKKNGTKKF